MQPILSPFAESIFRRTYAYHENETWEQAARRVAKAVANDHQQEEKFFEIIKERIFIPGGRYLYTSGREIFTNSNCYGFMVDDSREGWANLLYDATMCLSTGGGLGVNYSAIRGKGTPIKRMGGEASGPLALMQMVNEVARHVMAGGKRRSALWAGLNWNHPDILDFVTMKDWNEDLRAMKAKNFEYPAPLDMTNVSVIVGDQYIEKLNNSDTETWALHNLICKKMASTGEPAFRNQSRILEDDDRAFTGNACQESTLHDRDTCNLGSIVMPRIRSLDHLEEVTRLAIQFLYNGSLKATYPTAAIGDIARKNRRIGLGVMGLHEYMILNGHSYEWFPELEDFMSTWKEVCDDEAWRYATNMAGAVPVTTRAIAPTGTISIISETTSGVEPVFCVAYKRRYINKDKHLFQYVIDPTAKRLLDMGVRSSNIEDAYALAGDIERRLVVQANIQDYVDQAISNTVNLPSWGSDGNSDSTRLARVIAKYLPRIKGLTVYPDKSRPGQPLVPVSIEEALGQEGVVYEEQEEKCLTGVCGL